MGLSNSLFAGISGLDRQQVKLDVIGNNLANVNTYGFKSQRVLFQDVLYNTIRSGTAPDKNRGGTNPQQLGSGVDIAQVSTNFNQGDLETTGIDSDLAIEGNGFFVLRDGSSVLYTRDGAFTLNQERKLVNAASGMVVQGWNQTRDNAGNSSVNSGGATADVVIPVGDNRIAKASTSVVFNGNLNNQGDVGTTGTIFSSQRLFSSSSGDTEISSSAYDLSKVYIKDPAGGSDNVLLFKGTGSTTTESNVLTEGDQIKVQLMKGGRPLEAIFTYGDNDTFNNVTGVKSPDGVADAGLEHYDGTTLKNFLDWFKTAFGLQTIEDAGASSDTNAANGLDGDNPNDLVDMGLNSGDPFKDETDGLGFELGLASKGAASITGKTASSTTGPTAAMLGSSRTFNIIAGSASDAGTANSYVDLDGDSAYSKEKDLVLEGTTSYVVTGNSTVTAGAQAFGSTSQLQLRTTVALASQNGSIADKSDVFIDTDGDGAFDGGETVVKGAWSNDIFSSDSVTAASKLIASTVSDVNSKLTITFDTSTSTTNNNSALSTTTVTKGMTIWAGRNTTAGTTRYTVTDVSLNSTTNILTVTFDQANGTGNNAMSTTSQTNSSFVFEGAALVTAGYTATSASGFGSTLVTAMNVPISRLNSSSKYQGPSISNTLVDNEKGSAGAEFINGDIKAIVTDKPTAYLTASAMSSATDPNGKASITVTGTVATLALKTGMSTYIGTTKYTIDKITDDGTTSTIIFDKAPTTDTIASGQNVEFSGFGVLDSDGDGALNETVYRVRNDRADTASAVSGNLFIDLDADGVKDTADLVVETTSTKDNLSSFGDNEVVYKDTSGNVYRKVPSQFDPDGRLVYLDKHNKGTQDEVRFDVLNSAYKATITASAVTDATANDGILTFTASSTANLSLGMKYTVGSRVYEITGISGTTITVKASDTSEATTDIPTTSTTNWYQGSLWSLDEDFDGVVDSTDTNYLSTKDLSQTVVGETVSLNRASGVSINGLSSGSSRIQLRGNIGTVNELSQISFISGTDLVERQIFAGSALADSAGHGFSQLASANGESVVQNIVVYDSLGRSHDVAMTFALENKDNDKAEWRWYAETADATQAGGAFPVTDPRGSAPSINVGTGKVVFDNFGRFVRSEPTQPIISIPLEGSDTDSALNITPDFSIITAFANSTGSEVDVREQDGFGAGVMDRYAVNQDGTVTGIYTNGMREVVAQVSLAAFANPSGLIRAGNNIFKVGANSGNAMVGAALTGERGAVRSKALEQSNVDITREFTNMIITQRAYQANARLVTKSDELLQELMQIIR